MQFGDYRIEIVPEAAFRLDGGAMFGVVPRPLWERVCPPDDSNRIQMTTNCLFIEAGEERILIETGVGEKMPEKQNKILAVQHDQPFSQKLEQTTGYKLTDITIVVNSHLHFDHCGGNTKFDENGNVAAAFPNARYLVSRAEYEHAENPLERDRASYLPENWTVLRETGQLELMPAEYEIAPGLTMQTVRGHNAAMQTLKLERGGETLYGFVDLVPMRPHIANAWIMGYDLYPVETLENKQHLLPQAVAENWLCWFVHDPDAPLCRLTEENGKLKAVAVNI